MMMTNEQKRQLQHREIGTYRFNKYDIYKDILI